MNMRVDTANNLDPQTRVYDREFFDRSKLPSDVSLKEPDAETPAVQEESDSTSVYALVRREFQVLAMNSALDVFGRTPENRAILDPLYRELQSIESNMHDLTQNGQIGAYLNEAFDEGIERLVRADWEKLQAQGANWTDICSALHRTFTTAAELLDCGKEVRQHIADWFQYYVEKKMSRSQFRERRGQLNAQALTFQKDLAFASMHRDQTTNADQIMSEIMEQRDKVLEQLNKLDGYEDDVRFAAPFTKEAQDLQQGNVANEQTNRFMVPEYQLDSLMQFNVNSVHGGGKKQIVHREVNRGGTPSQQHVVEPIKVESPWVLQPKPKPQPKPEQQGFFGKLRSAAKKVAGWFGL